MIIEHVGTSKRFSALMKYETLHSELTRTLRNTCWLCKQCSCFTRDHPVRNSPQLNDLIRKHIQDVWLKSEEYEVECEKKVCSQGNKLTIVRFSYLE